MNNLLDQANVVARRVAPMALGLALVALLWTKAQTLDWAMVQVAFFDIPLWRWGAAALATGASFWAVAQYDVIAHRHLRTRLPEQRARDTGAAAIAIGQTTGLGPVVGAAIRWRLMPALRHGQILKIVAFVTLCFFLCWGILALTVALPVLAGLGGVAIVAFPMLTCATAVVILRHPRLRLFGRRLVLPSLPAFAKLLALAACDLLCAGLALHLLLPPEMAPPLFVLVAAFTLALGAGMVGGTPGGIGPFELALLALLPQTLPTDLAAALIGFRLIYYVTPCVLATLYLFAMTPCRQKATALPPAPLDGPRAELGITAQNDRRALVTNGAEACLIRSPQTLTLFLGPSRGDLAPLLPAHKRAALEENRIACLYKLTEHDAQVAQEAGWKTTPFAVEAVLSPAAFSLDGSDRRQLRRFLRKAQKAGVTCGPLTDPDWETLTEIHCAWEDMHGQERGLTMGRFCPLYLRNKPLFGAWQDGRLIAFISGLETPTSVSLDLMRHGSDLPQGTMHALVHAMIQDAAARGLNEMSLAALPHPSLPDRLADCAGLTRFKSSFAPSWRPLYIGAPNSVLLGLAAIDIRLAIVHPAPLHRTTTDLWELDAMIDAAIAPASPDTCDDQTLRQAG